MLLTRDEFRKQVFERDKNCCVNCNEVAVDAHHIIERRLWNDGGYYLPNGVALCSKCHLLAEQTVLSCEKLRWQAKICIILLPDQLYSGECYSKWGDILNSNGTRTPGELFFEHSVQKILSQGGFLPLYTRYIKYPRTYHLPWSPGTNSEDRILKNIDNFIGKEVIVTEKMDGENTTLYKDNIHARSISSDNHLSRDWVKAFHSEISYDIPDGWRFCGENLYAQHSIRYFGLKSYFLLFNIWSEDNNCLSWSDTVEWAHLLGIKVVPVLYKGLFDIDLIRSKEKLTRTGGLNLQNSEGYVVRLADSFSFSQFRNSVAKFVRKNHVQTSQHWKNQPIIKNELAHGTN